MEGWIRLHRKSVENPLYFAEPFTRFQAWTDLLIIANYKHGFFMVRGIKVTIKRGQVGYTAANLAERWKWSKNKVLRFLNDLKRDKQIETQKNNVTTLITILNYNQYQSDGTQNGTQTERKRHTDGSAEKTQTDPNKNIKKEKKEIDKSISLSEKERIFEIFFFEKGIINPEKEINRFIAHYEKIGWKDSHGNDIVSKSACALNWTTKEVTGINSDFMNRWKLTYNEISQTYPEESKKMCFGLKDIKIENSIIIVTATKALFDFIENSDQTIELFKKYFRGYQFKWLIPYQQNG